MNFWNKFENYFQGWVGATLAPTNAFSVAGEGVTLLLQKPFSRGGGGDPPLQMVFLGAGHPNQPLKMSIIFRDGWWSDSSLKKLFQGEGRRAQLHATPGDRGRDALGRRASSLQLSLVSFLLHFIFTQKNTAPCILLAYLFMSLWYVRTWSNCQTAHQT